MSKIDYRKELKAFYGPSAKSPVEVVVPPMNFLMIDGQGDPGEAPEYQEAVEALFTVSYTIKFKIKRGPRAIDYGVMPLEGLWWADDMSAFIDSRRGEWQWTMMIMQPELVAADIVGESIDEAGRKKGLPGIAKLRFESFEEGRAAQILHVGPFSEEGPTIAALHDFIEQRSHLRGRHHEIYLSDVRRADPRNWKTVLRQPME